MITMPSKEAIIELKEVSQRYKLGSHVIDGGQIEFLAVSARSQDLKDDAIIVVKVKARSKVYPDRIVLYVQLRTEALWQLDCRGQLWIKVIVRHSEAGVQAGPLGLVGIDGRCRTVPVVAHGGLYTGRIPQVAASSMAVPHDLNGESAGIEGLRVCLVSIDILDQDVL